MTITAKKALLNYLEFLQSNGFICLDSDPLEALGPASGGGPGAPSAAHARPIVVHSAAKVDASPMTPPRPRNPATTSGSAGAAVPSAPSAVPGPPPAALRRELPQTWGAHLSRAERIQWIGDATARAETCRACQLGAQRNKLVYGDGDPEAKIVFVGEAPGGDENETGIPFVGRAGQLLNKMLNAIGFKRQEVFICNTLKCRPPGNRDPFPSEKAACEHFLTEQFYILRPQILVALGAHAAQYLCRSELPIGKLRGRWHEYRGIAVRATYHPAFLLRNGNFKPQSWDDFRAIHGRYVELNPGDPRPIWTK
ncbi:MAG: uracil-DNA glycosylase [bacterium]|nr:uracil-DNA glycosylase [bacterium]